MSYTRYSYPEIEAIWDEENQFSTWLRVELAYLEARAEKGEIPREAWLRIKSNASFGSVEEVKELELNTKHDLVAFLRAVEKRLGPDFRYFHEGLTSQDVKDTSFSLLLKESGVIIASELRQAADVLSFQSSHYKYLPMIGRTHGIHAEPITFGLKLLRYKKSFERQYEHLVSAIDEVSVGKFSGAVGTYHSISLEAATRACQLLGLKPIYVTSQIVPRDIYAYFFFTLAVIAAVVEEIATEIRNLQRTEIGEVSEPFAQGQMGSSAMPHKRNPVLSEQLCGLSRVVRSNAYAVLENIPSWHERDISHSSVERIVTPLITNLTAYMLKTIRGILENLDVDEARMRENINLTGGLIFSQILTLALVRKGLSREKASQLVQALSLEALKNKEHLRSLTEREELVRSLLSEEEIEEIFNIKNFFKNIDRIFALEQEEQH
jgi:adenylosuccinate lyase